MKRLGTLLLVIVLLFATSAVIFAQDVKKSIEEMYKNREIADSIENMRIQKIFDEKQRLIQQEKEKEYARQNKWKQIVGPGPLEAFDRKKVEKALEGFVNLNDVLDSWKSEQNVFGKYYNSPKYKSAPTIKYFNEPMYTVYTKDIQVKDWKNRRIREDHQKLKGVDFVKIYHEPFLLFEYEVKFTVRDKLNYNPREVKLDKCLLVDSEYEVYDSFNCNTIPYTPMAEERKQALRDLGVSDVVIKMYAEDNPWNLVTYAACDNFDGHELVEKVVMAWRYSSISSISSLKNNSKPNHLKQYRYVYIQKDGKEKEEAPKESEELPKCFDLNRKKRNPLYKSATQRIPPNYDTGDMIISVWEKNVPHGGGCGGSVRFDDWDGVTPVVERESLLQADYQWFF